MEEAKPVVLTKPVRGREMLTQKGHVEPQQTDKKRAETYYEGYVDGQLFLVPDSNLEAMKDMINFKMRPKTSIRYKHQTSYDIQYYDQFTEKLNELLSKIDDFQESGDFERTKSIKQEESSPDKSKEEQEETGDEVVEKISSIELIEEESKVTMNEENEEKTISHESFKSRILEEIKSEIIEQLEREYELEYESTSSSSESSRSSKLSEGLDEPEREMKNLTYEETPDEPPTNEIRIRFLISGHFKDGEKPIYIVQEYDGKNDIFKDQKLDFTSTHEDSNRNIFISGKLYSENILVESEGKPSSLNTKPNKIIINEEKSQIFNDSFEYVFEKEDCYILLQGKFIKGDKEKITPSLSLFVKDKNVHSNSEDNTEKY